MANAVRSRQSSNRGFPSFRRRRRRPVQQAMMVPTNQERKEVVEPSSFKPQLSLLRDKDKLLLPRHRVPTMEHSTSALPLKRRKELRRPESNPSCCSVSSLPLLKEKKKTNGFSNSANNCPMALLKYFCPSVPFFFLRLLPSSTSCPCSFHTTSHQCYLSNKWANRNECDDRNNENKPYKVMKTSKSRSTSFSSNSTRNDKKFLSISVFVFVHFLLATKLIQVGNATPLPSIPTPTQITARNMAYSGRNAHYSEMKSFEGINKKEVVESQAKQDDEYRQHHQLYTINNTTFDGGGAGVDDELKEMKNEMNGIDTKGHSRGRNLYSDGLKNDSKNTSGNQVEFTSPLATPPQPFPNNNNNKNRVEFARRKEKEGLTTMPLPLAVRIRAGAMVLPSSSFSPALADSTSKQQQQDASIQMTNDISQESRSKNNGDDESRFVLINNNNNDSADDNSDFMRVPTTRTTTSTLGKCWAVYFGMEEMEENETEPLPSTVLSSVSNSVFISTPTSLPGNPIGLVCNGTNNLAITLSQIPEHLVHQAISITVKDSLISTLNLSLFHRFPRLEKVSVTHSNITQIIGTCPMGLKALNVSCNNIRKLNGSIFSTSGFQEGEYDYEELGAEDDTTAESNNDSENTVTNFSTELISSYFASSAEEQLLQQRNKSGPELELLSLSPSSSSSSSSLEPSNEKLPITSGFKTDYYYSKKLMRIPFVRSRTKKLGAMSFLTNEEKPNELGEKDSAAFGIGLDQRPHQQDDDELIKTSQRVSAGAETLFSETAKTNESGADDDEDDEIDGGDNNVLRRAHSTAETSKEEGKIARKATPTISSSQAHFSVDKEANTDCDVNDSLCQSVRFVRRRRAVTRDLEVYNDNDNHQPPQKTRDDENRNFDVLNSEGYIYEQEEKAGSEGRGRYYHHSSTSSSSIRGTASSIVNKWGNEINVESKPKPTLFPVEKGITSGTKRKRKARATTTTTSSSSSSSLSLEDIDLSHNKIFELPRALLQLESLKSLRLAGNQLKRDFVWEKLADWYMNSQDPTILKDGDDTFCGVVDDVRVFQFTVLGVLKAKKDLVETCLKVDKSICHECGLYSLSKQPGHGYNASHQSPHGNVAIGLKLDCSYRNLTELPAVPPQTWQLNVSGNSIKDLIPLKEPMYENLLILDADANEINTLDGLSGTSFLDRYNYLSLQNNRLSVIPTGVLSSLKNMRGQGVTLLGANFIECDCDTVKDIKPLLLENSKKIKDLKEIYCKDMKTRSGESFTAVKDLQYTDLCYLDSEESNEMYLYLVILIELLLIFVIVAKVWHDQRTFRRTGILPWCSAKMPRLPCDAMLESVKEPPHFNRSSSTNVRSYACEPPATQSISSCVQLREVRSNSGQSEKSSQISQLSSFPGSSRTSSV